MKNFNLKLVSPERTLYDAEVREIVVQTKSGEIAILAGHEPMVTQLSHGDILLKEKDRESVVAVYGGFLHVENNGSVVILADSAERIEEIDEKEAAEAVKKAEEAIAKAKASRERFAVQEGGLARTLAQDNVILAETQAELLKNLTRLKVARKHHSRRGFKRND